MENIENIKPNTPITLFDNKSDENKIISLSITNEDKSRQCLLELFIEDNKNNSRQVVERRMLNAEENFKLNSYLVNKDTKYIAIVSHCQIKINLRFN